METHKPKETRSSATSLLITTENSKTKTPKNRPKLSRNAKITLVVISLLLTTYASFECFKLYFSKQIGIVPICHLVVLITYYTHIFLHSTCGIKFVANISRKLDGLLEYVVGWVVEGGSRVVVMFWVKNFIKFLFDTILGWFFTIIKSDVSGDQMMLLMCGVGGIVCISFAMDLVVFKGSHIFLGMIVSYVVKNEKGELWILAVHSFIPCCQYLISPLLSLFATDSAKGGQDDELLSREKSLAQDIAEFHQFCERQKAQFSNWENRLMEAQEKRLMEAQHGCEK